MVRSEVKAFPKYKQETFKQIHDVVYSILKEGGFFNMYPSLVDDAGISLYYEKQSAKGNSQDVNSIPHLFSIWTNKGYIFNIRGKRISSLIPAYNRDLTDKEFNVITKNMEVISRLSGTRYYIASKIGPIKEFTISNRGCEFKSETGNTYTELKR